MSEANLHTSSPRNASSDCGPTAAQKVNDENYKRHHKQQVDQTAGHMETEAEKPQNQKHYENCPKHIYSPLLILKLFIFIS